MVVQIEVKNRSLITGIIIISILIHLGMLYVVYFMPYNMNLQKAALAKVIQVPQKSAQVNFVSAAPQQKPAVQPQPAPQPQQSPQQQKKEEEQQFVGGASAGKQSQPNKKDKDDEQIQPVVQTSMVQEIKKLDELAEQDREGLSESEVEAPSQEDKKTLVDEQLKEHKDAVHEQEKPELQKREKRDHQLVQKVAALKSPTMLENIEKKQTQQKPIEKNQKKPVPKKTISQQKPRFDLAKLTQGFLEHAQGEKHLHTQQSNHLINIAASRSGVASVEQLRYERYYLKAIEGLDGAFRIHKNKLRSLLVYPSLRELSIAIIFDRDGNHSLRLLDSSGSSPIDSAFMYIVEQALRSIPPLPQSFNIITHTVPLTLTPADIYHIVNGRDLMLYVKAP